MMGRSPCCDERLGLKKGPWTTEEDNKLVDFIQKHGHGSWRALPKLAGLNRCGKSCRLRWTNYLRPDIKRGKFTDEEEQIIINLHSVLGNKWSAIASNLQGRTDNEIKNYWNTHLRKKLMSMGIDPVTHRPRTDHLNLLANLPQLLAAANLSNMMINPEAVTQLAKVQVLQNLLQVLSTSTNNTSSSLPPPNMESINNHLFGTTTTTPLMNDPRLFEYLRAINNNTSHHDHHHLLNNGLVNNHGQVNLSHIHDYNQMGEPLNFPNLDAYTNGDGQQQVDHGNSYAISPDPNTNHMPPLVSASPPRRFNEEVAEETKMMMMMNNQPCSSTVQDMISNPSSTSTTIIEAWGDQLMDDEASDSYWKDIIDQVSSLPWTPST